MSDDPIKTVTKADVDGLLRHILRCPQVMQRAISKIDVTDFDLGVEKPQALIYSIAQDFMLRHKQMPTADLLYREIISRTHEHPEYDPQTVQSILNLAYDYMINPDDKQLVPSWALDVMDSFLFQRRVAADVLKKAEQFGNQLTRSQVSEWQERMISASIQRSISVDPFAMEGSDELIGTRRREPTGVQFVDAMLGGGTRPGELYGLLGPSGGGKTSFAHQLGVSSAKRHHLVPETKDAYERRHVYVFVYEENPVSSEYMVPVFSCATGMDRSIFDKDRDQVFAEMTDSQRERYRKAKEEIGTYLHYVDMSGAVNNAGRGGAHEIDAYLIEQQLAGHNIHGFIVDWMWPMFQRYFADYKVEREKMLQERGLAQRLMYDLKTVAERRGCWCWMNHQTAPAAVGKKKGTGWNDAAEFRSFAWLVNVCFTLGELDASNRAPFISSKNRGAKKSKLQVQLKGEISTFVALGGDWTWSSRAKTYVKEGTDMRVPVTGALDSSVGSEPPSSARTNYEGVQIDV
jgi:hypothetical protein